MAKTKIISSLYLESETYTNSFSNLKKSDILFLYLYELRNTLGSLAWEIFEKIYKKF